MTFPPHTDTPDKPQDDTARFPSPYPQPGLSDAGNRWLNAADVVLPRGGTVVELAGEIGEAFDITPVEALTAIVGALSLAVGPGVSVQNPIGCRMPLSMQIWVFSGANPNFDRALQFLCRDVIESYAGKFGRGILESDKFLIAQQLELENAYRAATANKNEFATFADDSAHVKQVHEELLLKDLLIRRKRCAFPFGNIINSKVISELISEERDFCFGSFGSDGGALRHLLGATPLEREKVLAFINSGFEGEVFPQCQKLPVFPVVSTIWLSNAELIDASISEGLHAAISGVLVTPAKPSERGGKTKPLSSEAREKWKNLLNGILQTLRLPFFRRYATDAQGHKCELVAEALETLAETSEWATGFSSGPGYSRTVLARAPEQILKMSGLLNLEPIPPQVIGRETVLLAMEVFRWLAKGTFEAASRHQATVLTGKIEMICDKLRHHGAMSARDIVRTCHRMTYASANEILTAAILSGKIEEVEGRYRVIGE